MMMRGKEIASMRELWANFAIDDLINAYYSGELEFSCTNAARITKQICLRISRTTRICLCSCMKY